MPLSQASSNQRFGAFITEASQRFGIPDDWIRAVMHAESDHVDDVSSAGAMGLMQIMPDTWTELRARYRLGADPFDPHDNILAGAAYMRELLDRYGNVDAMLAAYNAGPARYDAYLATGRALPAETRDYVAKVGPTLGVVPLPEIIAAVPQHSVDWREAPLFVSATVTSAAGSLQPDRQTAASALSTTTSSNAAASLPTGGIFVTVSGRNSTP